MMYSEGTNRTIWNRISVGGGVGWDTRLARGRNITSWEARKHKVLSLLYLVVMLLL